MCNKSVGLIMNITALSVNTAPQSGLVTNLPSVQTVQSENIQDVLFSASKHKPCKNTIQVNGIKQTKNACGTTSLAVAINALKEPSKKIAPAQIDAVIRKMSSSFTAPDLLIKEAEKHGLKGGMYNNSSFDEIKTHIDDNHLMIALTDTRRNELDVRMHYVLINGYEVTEDGTEKVIITNPSSGKTYTQDYEKFEEKWNDLKLSALPTSLNRFMIALSTENDLPKNRLDKKAKLALNVGEGVNKVLNGISGFLKKGKG